MSGDAPEGWELTQIGDMIKESRLELAADDPSKRLAVRLHLKGVEKRAERSTDRIGPTKYFQRKQGQFIYGKQNLHKGAVGLIPKKFDGYSSSQDIPAFDFLSAAHPRWFFQYFNQTEFLSGLERIATGTGSKRIQPKELYLESILLPPQRTAQDRRHTERSRRSNRQSPETN